MVRTNMFTRGTTAFKVSLEKNQVTASNEVCFSQQKIIFIAIRAMVQESLLQLKLSGPCLKLVKVHLAVLPEYHS